MSTEVKSKYDEYGYTKVTIELNGKSMSAAKCWVCELPLHNTGITSLKRHRNKCKLTGCTTQLPRSSMAGEKDTKKCFLCDNETDRYVSITTKSKHTETRINEFVQQFLNDGASDRKIEHDAHYSCGECFDKINEYDLACSIAARVAEEMCEILKRTESKLNDDNAIVEIEVEPDDVRVQDGDDFVQTETCIAIETLKEKEQGEEEGEGEEGKGEGEGEEEEETDKLSEESDYDIEVDEGKKVKARPAKVKPDEMKLSHECNICSATFPTLKHLRKHRAEHRNVENRFRCNICNFDAKEENALAEHVEMHRGLSPLQCVVCKKVFRHKRNIIPHMRLHTGEKVYQCDRCGKKYFHKSSFTIHMYYHDGVKTVKCRHCTRLFLLKSDLDKHMRVHTGDKPYACDICDKRFARRDNMREHRKIHDKQMTLKIHKCTFCDASFARKSKLAKHLEKHGAIEPHSEIRNNLQSELSFEC